MRRAAWMVAGWAALLLVPLSAAAQQDATPGGATSAGTTSAGTPAAPLERAADVWSAHALTDEDAARQGRAALPFTQEQIETLGRLLRDTQQATARGAGDPPAGRVRRIRLDAAGGIPQVALRRGYTTVVSFTDATGAPWPIEEALVDRRFLPPGTERAREEEGSASAHLLYLAPSAAYLAGNVAVKLAGLADPVVASLRETGADADFRVEIRLGIPGPNADPGMLAGARGFHAGDALLLDLLGGRVPPDAERLAVGGGDAGDRAWRRGGDLLLVTHAHLLSPGPLAAERGPGGRWAYRLPHTPLVLVSAEGRARRLSLAPTGGDQAWTEAGDEN